ncbi:MAG: winged helix-turn-helix domain-containing protein [Desulfobacteraceae bacterium]|nr:MAG: winged helix-turn-helix domain-containing protein [Desulfobacteraceae bacterium]
MTNLIITKQQARRFLLAHQGLWPPTESNSKKGVLDFIRRVGCIQFDPLNIVGRNPDLVLQARFRSFRPDWLQELLYQDRKLVDGWDKNLSIYHINDWPYFRRHREQAKNSFRNSEAVKATAPQICQAIRERGPLSSRDLGFNEVVDWPWAPTRLSRATLESLYFQGTLVIHHKSHTRKVYDLAQRHVPEKLLSAADPNEKEEPYHDWYVLRRIGSIGLLWNRSSDAWLGMADIKGRERQAAIERLLENRKIQEVRVEGIRSPFYMSSKDRSGLNQVIKSKGPVPRAAILAPLDNLLWDRRLIEELFGFDYRWEVYKPVTERSHGYYVLPILYKDRFVARFEPGREKATGAVIIKNWWWEAEITPSKRMQADLQVCFKRFLNYLGADRVHIDKKIREKRALDWL